MPNGYLIDEVGVLLPFKRFLSWLTNKAMSLLSISGLGRGGRGGGNIIHEHLELKKTLLIKIQKDVAACKCFTLILFLGVKCPLSLLTGF